MTVEAVAGLGTASAPAWRLILFRALGGLVAAFILLAMGGLTTLLEPWGIRLIPAMDNYTWQEHLWHNAGWAAQMTLTGLSLVALLVRPRNRILLAFFVLAMVGFVATIAPFPYSYGSPVMLVIPLVLTGIVLAAYPYRRDLTIFGAPRDRILLGLAVAVAIVFAAAAASDVALQIAGGTDEHAVHHHWITNAYAYVLVVAAIAIASTALPGGRALGVLGGLALGYLGAAAIAAPANPGSWGVAGGIVAVVLGIGTIASAVRSTNLRGG